MLTVVDSRIHTKPSLRIVNGLVYRFEILKGFT